MVVTKPSASSCARASRTGTRDTPNVLAMASSISRSPLARRPDRMSSRSAPAIVLPGDSSSIRSGSTVSSLDRAPPVSTGDGWSHVRAGQQRRGLSGHHTEGVWTVTYGTVPGKRGGRRHHVSEQLVFLRYGAVQVATRASGGRCGGITEYAARTCSATSTTNTGGGDTYSVNGIPVRTGDGAFPYCFRPRVGCASGPQPARRLPSYSRWRCCYPDPI